jgi:hypothetical protein
MCRYWVPNEEPVPDFELDDGSGSKIRRDYYRLLTDLYIRDHLLVLQAWSVSRSMRHKAQVAYGQNLEPIRSNREFVRSGGRAEGESLNSGDRAPMSRDQPTWKFALDWQRCLVGGAHQGGAVRVSTELGAQFQAAFAFSLGDYKQLLDKEWAAGITKPFVHGFRQPAGRRGLADAVPVLGRGCEQLERPALPGVAELASTDRLLGEGYRDPRDRGAAH